MNPFSNEYFQLELANFCVPEKTLGNAKIIKKDVYGRIEGYMYRDLDELLDIPVLYVDGQLWMSITPMEVQSTYMPIVLAEGVVGTGGLGIGYFVQRVLDKPEVDEVIVYETNKDVIALYLDNFGEHPKLEIRNYDMRKMNDQEFDFLFVDLYKHQLDDNIFKDMALFGEHHLIGQYHFWTQEMAMWELAQAGYGDTIPRHWRETYRTFFNAFKRSDKYHLQQITGAGELLYKDLQKHGIISGDGCHWFGL